MTTIRFAACLLIALLSAASMPAFANETEGHADGNGRMTANTRLTFRVVVPERLLLPAAHALDDARIALAAPGARRVTETIGQDVVTTIAAP